jgi:hypothetical protein
MVLAITAGCRLGFDDVPPLPDGPGSAAVVGLTCTGPQRFSLGTDLAGIAATATTNGFAVATVDANGNLGGWSFTLADGVLTESAQNVALGTNANGTVGIASSGDTVIVAASNGSPATGSTLYALYSESLAQAAVASVRDGQFAAPVPVASNGGTFAYLSQLADTSVQLRGVDDNANDVGNVITLTSMADNAYSPSLVAGPGGYALAYGAWNIDGGAAIAVYDNNLAALIAPQKIEANPSYFAEQPVIAYAAQAGEYLVSWHIKDSMNLDQIYARLLGPDFTPIGDPFAVASDSNNALISSDGTYFYLGYRSYDPNMVIPDHLGAAEISSTGVVTPIAIDGDGGAPSSWTFVTRDGQTILVWREQGGSGPDLYFDPLCN